MDCESCDQVFDFIDCKSCDYLFDSIDWESCDYLFHSIDCVYRLIMFLIPWIVTAHDKKNIFCARDDIV